MPNPGGHFKFKIGERVWYRPHLTYYPSTKPRRVRIIKRTVEAALGKTYLIRHQDGRLGGYVPEDRLSRENSNDE